MARASHVEIAISAEKIPMMSEAKEYALMGLIPAGSYATKHFCEHMVEIKSGLETIVMDLIFDPQTSGGLIISIGPDNTDACVRELRDKGVNSAAVIAEVIGPHPKGKLLIA
jgi:selenide,water dikinase